MMFRRLLPLLIMLAGVFVLGMLGYVFATSRNAGHPQPTASPGAPAASQRSPATEVTGEPDATAEPLPAAPHAGKPSPHHGNTIVAKPFPEHPELNAMLVDINVDGGNAALAFGRLGDVSGVPIAQLQASGPPTPDINTNAVVNLALSEQPFLEAVLEIQSQAPVTANLSKPGELTPHYDRRYVPPVAWSIAGPFAFVIDSVADNLDGTVNGVPANQSFGLTPDMFPADPLFLFLHVQMEPRLKVLTYATSIDLREAVDDHGNSLIPSPAARQRVRPPGTHESPLIIALSHSAVNPGRTIKHLSGVAHYALQMADEVPAIVVDDPLHKTPITETFEGMSVTFETPRWNAAEQGFDMTVTYTRGQYAGDWAAFTKGLAGVKPRATQSTGHDIAGRAFSVNVNGDTARVSYGIQFALGSRSRTGLRVMPRLEAAPEVENFIFDMPISAVPLDVPVDFKDIPMP